MQRLARLAGFAMVVVLTASTVRAAAPARAVAPARATSDGGFGAGYTDIGPVVGFGSIGGAGLSFGGRFEHGIKTLPSLGDGVLSVAAGFDYYNYSDSFVGYSWSFTYMPVGVTVNYHFRLSDKKIDPFIGLGLGDLIASCSTDIPGYPCSYSNSGIYFIGRAGIRYFLSPSLAAYADAGTGGGAVHAGIMLKLKGGK